jgi:hypothetical protein
MLKRKHSELDESDPPPRRDEHTRPTFLQIRLPNEYRGLLSDLLLLDVARVEYVQANGNTAQYLYKVLSILLDKVEEELQLYTTPSGRDASDDDSSWNFIPNDEQKYQGGSYLCRPRQGMSLYHIVDLLMCRNLMSSSPTPVRPG